MKQIKLATIKKEPPITYGMLARIARQRLCLHAKEKHCACTTFSRCRFYTQNRTIGK